MENWLDTETKAILHRRPPEKLAPPMAGPFTLVLIARGPDQRRLARALQRSCPLSEAQVRAILRQPDPIAVAKGFSLDDATLGQFEFVCCDSSSVFLEDAVFQEAEEAYLNNLYSWLRESREFEELPIRIWFVPESDGGLRFLDQFFGWDHQTFDRMMPRKGVLVQQMMRKKARIMAHWAAKIGAEVSVNDA